MPLLRPCCVDPGRLLTLLGTGHQAPGCQAGQIPPRELARNLPPPGAPHWPCALIIPKVEAGLLLGGGSLGTRKGREGRKGERGHPPLLGARHLRLPPYDSEAACREPSTVKPHLANMRPHLSTCTKGDAYVQNVFSCAQLGIFLHVYRHLGLRLM